jgi:hypothetical protein
VVSLSASAQHGRGHGGHGWHHGHGSHRHHNSDWIIPAIITGTIVYSITRPPVVVQQPPVVIQPSTSQVVIIGGVIYTKQIMIIDGVQQEVLVRQ